MQSVILAGAENSVAEVLLCPSYPPAGGGEGAGAENTAVGERKRRERKGPERDVRGLCVWKRDGEGYRGS